MRALTVIPLRAGSAAVVEMPDPEPFPGELLDVVFGSVNANLHHYALAADALGRADRAWLERLITRRVPLDDFRQAVERRGDDVKVVLEL